MQCKNLRKLFYFINDHQSAIILNLSNQFKAFKDIVEQSENIDITNYDIIYSKKNITDNDDVFLWKIIGNDMQPIFFFKRKGIASKGPTAYTWNKPLKKNINIRKEQELLVRLLIINPPSNNEILLFVKFFSHERKMNNNYSVDILSNSLRLTFMDSEFAYSFFKFLNNLKVQNFLYSKMDVKLINDGGVSLDQNSASSKKRLNMINHIGLRQKNNYMSHKNKSDFAAFIMKNPNRYSKFQLKSKSYDND